MVGKGGLLHGATGDLDLSNQQLIHPPVGVSCSSNQAVLVAHLEIPIECLHYHTAVFPLWITSHTASINVAGVVWICVAGLL